MFCHWSVITYYENYLIRTSILAKCFVRIIRKKKKNMAFSHAIFLKILNGIKNCYVISSQIICFHLKNRCWKISYQQLTCVIVFLRNFHDHTTDYVNTRFFPTWWYEYRFFFFFCNHTKCSIICFHKIL